MTDYNDGKIHGWNGGDCPVHPESIVEVWLHRGNGDTQMAESWHWKHNDTNGKASDIIAFRVVKQHVEPKSIWVNEHENDYHTYRTEEAAKRHAGSRAIRTAVEYREVRK